MDSFGVQTVPCVGITGQFKGRTFAVENRAVQLRFSGKRLSISRAGVYTLTIVTAAGKVMGGFSAKGDASFVFDRPAGIYLVNIATKKGFETRRFVIY
jgi:hypothetical protein